MNTIGNHIRRLRFDNSEMTQAALAQAVGITRQTIIALEAERYAPSLELAMKIAEVFNKKVDEIFFRRPSQ
jgi:putative transcriptional regulator